MKRSTYILKLISKAILHFPQFGGIILGLLLLSCSEDLDISNGILNKTNDDYISVDFLILQEEHIVTRSDGNEPFAVKNLSVFIFDGSGNFIQKEDFPTDKNNLPPLDSENQFSIQIEKNSESKKADNLSIYVLANAKEIIDNELVKSDFVVSKENLRNITVKNYRSDNGFFFMAGTAEVSVSTSVNLIRTAGKISVSDSNEEDHFTLKGFYIYGPAESCYVSAGESETIIKGNLYGEKGFLNSSAFTSEAFVMPTNTFEKKENKDTDIKTYIVIEGTFDEKPSYYAIPLYSQLLQKHFDIKPNHSYDIIIQEVNHAGLGSKEEAIKSPCDYIIYEIHDHTPEILSMASDGIHELGVTHNIELEEQTDGTYSNFIIKWYSAKTKEKFDLNDLEVEIIEGKDWMSLSGPVKITAADDLSDEDKKLFGEQFSYKVSLSNTRFTDQEGKIKVTWKTLEREVIVKYDPGFGVSKACTTNLFIKNGEEIKFEIEEYFAFLQQETGHRYKLFGVGADEMADGKVRNEGFHFPMPYGVNAPDISWTYEYLVDFTPLKKVLPDIEIKNITTSVSGNTMFQNLTWTYDINKKSGTLSLDESYPTYNYATGKIVFKVDYEEKGQSLSRNFNLDLYHTGFFHYENNQHQNSDGDNMEYVPVNDTGFYYYEVIQMGTDTEGKPMYWLDRNIGAKSNMMYVDASSASDSQESSGYGNPDAKGKFLKISKYKEKQYADPTVILDMCPPGYHIPVSSEWNAVRLSEKLVTGDFDFEGQSYTGATYYQSAVGKIYFPRAKYFNSKDNNPIKWMEETANSGDPSTGYYWTATAAPGMEKLEMGKWLRALYLNGSQTTYQNTNVVESKMNVRCVAGATIPDQDNHYISINVHNVTHVYIFDPVSRSALYTFPGKGVGTTASASKWQNFTCTTSSDINGLALLFTKVEEDGSVTMFTKYKKISFTVGSSSFNSIINSAIDAENYWNIENGWYYDFCTTKEAEDEEGKKISVNLIKKRLNDEQNNVFKYINEDIFNQYLEAYCSYSEETNSGTPGTDPTPDSPSYKFNPEYSEKEISIMSGNQVIMGSSSWGQYQDLAYGRYDWSKVPVGSTLKIYVVPTGGDFILQTFSSANSGWQWLNEYKNPRPHVTDQGVYIVDIELTQPILNQILRDNGFVIQGMNFTMIGITLIEGEGGNYSITNIYTSENYNINLGDNYDCTVYNIPWDQAEEGDILTLIMDIWWAPEFYFSLLNKNNKIVEGTQEKYSWNIQTNNYPCEIELTQKMLEDLRSNGNSLVITGNQGQFKYLEINRIKPKD